MRQITAVALSFWLAAGVAVDAVAVDKPRLAYRSHPIEGTVADAQTKKPIADAVINAAWVLQPVNQGKMINGHRFYIEQVKTGAKGHFIITGWPGIKKAPQGWQLEPGSDPVLTVFHARYRHRVLSNTRPTPASVDAPSP
ncbi:MAG: hypothetical protein OEY67_08520, partial [Gammaproteobacteria bacterium]|nr:hypothetical protein [Gammaproteobacteria bacterium]